MSETNPINNEFYATLYFFSKIVASSGPNSRKEESRYEAQIKTCYQHVHKDSAESSCCLRHPFSCSTLTSNPLLSSESADTLTRMLTRSS